MSVSYFSKPDDFDDTFKGERLKRSKTGDTTFEFGLVLAGAVSAGAYTAGFIDFLVEALDQYHEEAGKLPGGAPHKVVLKVLSGTSGGGMVAAQMGRALKFDFPHVSPATDPETAGKNLFYSSWVKDIDIDRFLDTKDLKDHERAVANAPEGSSDTKTYRSILNTKQIDNLAAQACEYGSAKSGVSLPLKQRDWVADPLDLYLTFFNMRGVPYFLKYGKDRSGRDLGQTFRKHDDFIHIQLYQGALPSEDSLAKDVIAFDMGPEPINADYATFAVATGAFPLALRAVTLTRPFRHYLYRPVVVTKEITEKDGKRLPEPAYDLSVQAPLLNKSILYGAGVYEDNIDKIDYSFIAVDGGTAHVEPLELARTNMAGLIGRNPRDSKTAHRAVVLVAPLHNPVDNDGIDFTGETLVSDPAYRIEKGADLFSLATGILPRMRNELQLGNAQLSLATDDDVFSRFMVIPARTDPTAPDGGRAGGDAGQHEYLTGDDAICSSGLAAFLGFLDEEYRRHDYFLGRRNAWEFLNNTFRLHKDNPVFEKWTDDHLKAMPEAVKTEGGSSFRPILPLVGSVKDCPAEPSWPFGRLSDNQIERYHDLFRERVGPFVAMFDLEEQHFVLRWLSADAQIARALAKEFKNQIAGSLKEKKLRAKDDPNRNGPNKKSSARSPRVGG